MGPAGGKYLTEGPIVVGPALQEVVGLTSGLLRKAVRKFPKSAPLFE